MNKSQSPFAIANIRYFISFRLFFNSRFYYPVFTILFLDYGLTIEQFALLNSVWAATIVIAEVPSGALADLLGRKQLLFATSILMMLEMALLSFVPTEDISLVFYAFLFNRILSGLAEAMASGADEALAYDSLVAQGDKDDWPRVLSVMMRLRALGSMITMSLGALIYDPEIVNRLLQFSGSSLVLGQQTTMRFPIYLTLLLAIFSCITVLLMQEPGKEEAQLAAPSALLEDIVRTFRLVFKAGSWIFTTPFAFAVILFAMGYDHILRMVLTMTSQYFRLINLPEASFGLIGASLSMVGLFIPKIAEMMVQRYSPVQNMWWLSFITITGLLSLNGFIPYWGLIPMTLVAVGLQMTSFFTSHYLNRITESNQRATVLSFKGLAFNLAYGLIGVGFALLIASIREKTTSAQPHLSTVVVENISFKSAFVWFIPYTLVLLLIFILLTRYLLRNSTVHTKKG